MRNLLFAEEHMLGAAESNSLRPKRPRLYSVARNVCVRTNFHLAIRICPLHELLQLRIVRGGIQRIQLSFDHTARGSVERDPVSLFERLPFHSHLARFFVDIDIACSRHATLAHAAGHDCGVTRHATSDRENSFRAFHPMNVFWSRLGAY